MVNDFNPVPEVEAREPIMITFMIDDTEISKVSALSGDYIVPPEIISGQTRRPFACAFPAAPLFCSCPHISDCVTHEKRHGSASADHFDHASPRHPAGSLFSSAGTRRL